MEVRKVIRPGFINHAVTLVPMSLKKDSDNVTITANDLPASAAVTVPTVLVPERG